VVTSPHIVRGTATISGTSVGVTLTGSAVFANATSYVCTANDQTTTKTIVVEQSSGTAFTLTTGGGGNGDTVGFICVGN
jgi:hypothetical protein